MMSWKTLCQMDLNGKRVLTRVDLNVPIVDGKITDATRIKKNSSHSKRDYQERWNSNFTCPYGAS